MAKSARKLTPEELDALAQKLVCATNTVEQRRLKAKILAGFYGVPQREVARLLSVNQRRRKSTR